jgi:hypothetical protein
MSSNTTFECDFCGKSIVDAATNPDFIGWCRFRPEIGTELQFGTILRANLKGPHICMKCVEAINSVYNDLFRSF